MLNQMWNTNFERVNEAIQNSIEQITRANAEKSQQNVFENCISAELCENKLRQSQHKTFFHILLAPHNESIDIHEMNRRSENVRTSIAYLNVNFFFFLRYPIQCKLPILGFQLNNCIRFDASNQKYSSTCRNERFVLIMSQTFALLFFFFNH